MAQGRIIVNAITSDKKINSLSDDTSRLAFTWLITFADCEGRTHGDPAVIRSMLFPRRQDVTIEQMEKYITEWASVGLIIWYEADGDKWIYFPRFEKNQPGLRKDREAPSRIPEYVEDEPDEVQDEVQDNSGVTPEQLPVKLKEVKRKEVKGATPPNFRALSENTVAQKVYFGVTGFASLPSAMIEKSYQLWKFAIDRGGIEQAAEYLKPFYDEWITRKNKAGALYSKTGSGWVDWAISGEIPGKNEAAPITGRESRRRLLTGV